MPPRKDRLFDLKELGTRAPKQAHRQSLHAADSPSEQVRLNRDGAGLVPGITDGLPVRTVKAHSAQKARMVSRDLGTVGRAMNRKWFEVHYLELFCGPGYLYDESTGEEVPGSPIQALTLAKPFDRYVFADYSTSASTHCGPASTGSGPRPRTCQQRRYARATPTTPSTYTACAL